MPDRFREQDAALDVEKELDGLQHLDSFFRHAAIEIVDKDHQALFREMPLDELAELVLKLVDVFQLRLMMNNPVSLESFSESRNVARNVSSTNSALCRLNASTIVDAPGTNAKLNKSAARTGFASLGQSIVSPPFSPANVSIQALL